MTVDPNIKWTLQSAFVASMEHLLKMPHASTNTLAEVKAPTPNSIPFNSAFYNGCAYRALDGGKCAIGCLIPDEQYTPDLETKSCNAVAIMQLPCFEQIQRNEWWILRGLQIIHDTINNWGSKGLNEKGKRELANLAQAHSIKIPEELKAYFNA